MDTESNPAKTARDHACASPEAAGAMRYDALAAIVREKRTATRKKSSRRARAAQLFAWALLASHAATPTRASSATDGKPICELVWWRLSHSYGSKYAHQRG